jgi:DUF4097 and DUF4098 domain-containing protein YvlB
MINARTGLRIAAAALFIVAASFIPRRAHAYETYTSPRNAEVSTSGARVIRIDAGAGLLRVEGRSDINQVRVRGTAKASRKNILDDIRLIAERRGDEVYIKADIKDDDNYWRSGSYERALDLIIEVPTSLPLEVDDGSGEAEFINTGKLDFEDGSGEIKVRGTHGNVEINDGSGNIDVQGVEGSVRVHDGSGNIRGRNVTGSFVVAEDGSGDIDVSDVGGEMRVENDGSGNIDVDRIAGDFVVESDGSGSIRYDTVKGSVRIPERRRRG